MDELIDIVDEAGNITGEICLKSKAHRLGFWHLCVDIWLYTDKGDILIQKRAADKDVFPNLWDVSVAGHVGAGELPLNAAQRELQEELGLGILSNELKFIGNYKTDFKHNEHLTDKEFHHIYIAKFKGALKDITLQAEEVSEIKFVPVHQIENIHLDKKFIQKFVPYSNKYFNMVFQEINKLL